MHIVRPVTLLLLRWQLDADDSSPSLLLRAPSGRCYVRYRRGRWSSCPPLSHLTSVPTGPQSSLRSQAGPSTPHVLRQRRQVKVRVCRLLPCTRLSTLGGIRRHSEGRVLVPHSHRRTSHCAGGLSACYTRLHVCRRGPCRHQVREWQLSSKQPQEARTGQAVCRHGIHKSDTA